jgi:multidrug efflux system membrane fusion protein
MMRNRFAPAAALLVLGLALAGCEEKNEYVPPPPPSVTVAKPVTQQTADFLELTGSTSAFQSVDLVARIEGFLQSIGFTDGATVPKDQQLFVIEPEPYQAKLAEAQASVDQTTAALATAQSEYDRQGRMIKDKATSQESLEQAQSNLATAKANLEQANADLTLAQINLSYTEVKAPFDGRMGRHLVDVGNLVGAGTPTTLATIEQIDPLYVYFTLNEIDVLRIKEAMRQRGVEKAPIGTLPIFVGLQTEEGFPHEGTLDFVNSGLDTSTGVLQLRALLKNSDNVFLPGLFVRVRVPISQPAPGLFVPDAVVGYDQAGHYVLVVGADNKVERRTVEIGGLEGKLRQIASGLKDDERVVIDGILKAVPGNAVTPTDGQIAVEAPKQ